MVVQWRHAGLISNFYLFFLINGKFVDRSVNLAVTGRGLRAVAQLVGKECLEGIVALGEPVTGDFIAASKCVCASIPEI